MYSKCVDSTYAPTVEALVDLGFSISSLILILISSLSLKIPDECRRNRYSTQTFVECHSQAVNNPFAPNECGLITVLI